MAKNTAKKVLGGLRKGENSTVQAVAKRAGVEQQVARRHLDDLVAAGSVEQTTFKQTGKRGRPAKLYTKVTAPVA